MKRNNFYFIGVLALVVSVMSCSPDKSKKQIQPDGISKNAANIQIVNHRGANRLAPENTYASATKAIESGAAYVEVDVRRSKDGVYYNFHDNTLDRTTNGSGLFSETTSAVIDTLDAGAWFAHQFAGEKVPRLFEYLPWIKGKAKIYFDMKNADMEDFISKIYELGMENDCFFWFSDWQQTKKFRELYPKLALKVNASTTEALDSLKTVYNPQIIECSVDDLSEEFIRACHSKDLKVMPHVSGNDWEAYRMALAKDIDMINLDCPDVFANMAKNNGTYKGYKLIAHRGGIVEGKYNEFDPASIQAAIDQGYFMLEIDVQQTKDGVLIVNHDPNFTRFFNDPRQVSEMTWEEVQKLRPVNGRDYHPLSFEEVARMCSGKIRMMIDIKKDSPAEFYYKLGEIMEKYDLLQDAYFIDVNARKYFWGKAKFSIRTDEIGVIKEKLAKGEDVACHYFFFEGGPRLTATAIKMCQKASVTVVPTVNFGHYRDENAMRGAKRDIEYLKACGVTEYQIDSDFDDWLPNK
ncbi:MAG: glycerophosphodiester phosphodiesterase family protein [Prolixibacteraceae bacterium]|jgi:glycerophosphoryl diester phosphodiesterase|nr:glycerophosphodiester phosphodiesterase family protein [Prolixibacteraceae bacterium]